ncbi:Holliday junction resolvase RuvX [Schleiferia thermophila]|uniref:Holliday junction resolvase RuvX n=1 Tax=Schleiferia thermophila TaxID=884107 RepID=UPI0021AB2797|nr:Holliday junction resolvase RuvX [Schleiferia thermophila]
MGLKRCGIAETDALQIIASPRATIDADKIEIFLSNILKEEPVESIVIGLPLDNKGNLNEDVEHKCQKVIHFLRENFPEINIFRIDERYSSKLAQKALIQSGMKKKKRKIKGNLDQVSAAILLQDFLDLRHSLLK